VTNKDANAVYGSVKKLLALNSAIDQRPFRSLARRIARDVDADAMKEALRRLLQGVHEAQEEMQ
jgi:hypothetical protein